jgi:hypothetical protein
MDRLCTQKKKIEFWILVKNTKQFQNKRQWGKDISNLLEQHTKSFFLQYVLP